MSFWRMMPRLIRRGGISTLKFAVCMIVVTGILLFWTSDDENTQTKYGVVPRVLDTILQTQSSKALSDGGKISNEFPNNVGERDVIIYNRVPKCASTSTRTILSMVGKQNDLNVYSSKIYAQEYLNNTAQMDFIQQLESMQKPLLFIRHMFFVDFTKFGLKQPIYINMIRDPLDRLVSDYYFKRYNLASMFPMSTERREMNYNDCVQGNHSECVADSPKGYFRVIPYFCGMDKKCLQPKEHGAWALNQAKRHVEQYFHVVGTVEHVSKFLDVLEITLPQYFTGIGNLYKKGGQKFKSFAKTFKKDPVEERTREIMTKKLAYDYDFYNYIKQRFTKQYIEVLDNR